MRNIIILSLIIVAAVALSACADLTVPGQGPQPYPAEGDMAPTRPAGDVTSPQPDDSGAPYPASEGPIVDDKTQLPEGVVIEFHRSGGFAGLDETWQVYTDGRITKSQAKNPEAISEYQVKAEQVQALLAEIDELGFFRMQASGSPGIVCCDQIGRAHV